MNDNTERLHWRKCGSCKKEIKFGGIYQACSVSSCRKLVYCSVTCWDTHVPVMNHKSAYAEERVAPQKESFMSSENQRTPRKIIVSSSEKASKNSDVPKEILVVASKLKSYVKSKHDYNTSSNVLDKLSDIIRYLTDQAIENARNEGRKTLMDRDFTSLL